MRKKNLYYLFIGLLVLLSACTDEEVSGLSGQGSCVPGKVELRLIIPTMTNIQTRTEASDETSITSLHLVTYKGAECVDCQDIISKLVSDGSGYKLTLDLQEEVSDIHLVANAGGLLDTKPTVTLDKLFTDASVELPLLMWAHISVSDIKEKNITTVSLLRNVAKATISVSEGVAFEVTAWKIINTAAKGSIAPKDNNPLAAEANTETDETYQREIGDLTSTNPLYFYETPAANGNESVNTRMLIKGSYKEKDYYYTAFFMTKNDSTQLSLLRNHHYQVNITGISTGYATKEEALAAPAGNVSVEIMDYNYLISDMVSNGEYELGVCDTVHVDADANTFADNAYFVIMRNTAESNPQLSPVINVINGADWLTEVTYSSQDIASGEASSNGSKYALTFTCKNNPTEETRYGVIQVSFQRMWRNIVIEQKGVNLKKARNTLIFGLKDSPAEGVDYVKFINEVKGVSVGAMGGEARNNGLQLGIGDEKSEYCYNYSYKINTEGDKSHSVNDGRISCRTEGDYYVIEVNDKTDSSWWIAKDAFQVVNSEGVTIKYDIYHTGIFWEEKGTNQPTMLAKAGWFYYELVQGQNGMWMFDRNLGAASVDDAGAYYQLKDGDKENAMADFCPPGFILPSIYLWEDLLKEKLKFVIRNKADGSSYHSIEIDDKSGKRSIRFPSGGYCIGDGRRNETAGYYWSTSLVAGNQGFDINSKEYGYWYRIARVSVNGYEVSSIRYADGSNGVAQTPYRYMNVRCVKMADNLIGNKNELTIIDRRSADQKKLDLCIYLFTDRIGDGTIVDYRNSPGGELISQGSADAGDSDKTLHYDMIDPDMILTSIGSPLLIQFKIAGVNGGNDNWLGERTEVGNLRTFVVTDVGFYGINTNGSGTDDMPGENWPGQ